MKKLLISFVALALTFSVNAQAVSDNAVIPVSVSLTGILRLNVVSGGNIEFMVNTLDQYTNGIANTTRTTTKFSVSSSTDFNVTLQTEDATFIGVDDPSNTMTLDNVSYVIETAGGVAGTDYTTPATSPADIQHLTSSAVNIVEGATGHSAGNAAKNSFLIRWSLNNPNPASAGSLLAQSIKPDRYSTNVFLTVVRK